MARSGVLPWVLPAPAWRPAVVVERTAIFVAALQGIVTQSCTSG